jgi:SCY1-like protein 1
MHSPNVFVAQCVAFMCVSVQLSDSEFLKNDLIDTVHTLENLGLREPLEKTKFFRNLPKLLPQIPPSICTRKLLPLISAALEFGGAPALALGSLLQIGKMLGDEDDFKARIVPILSALFASPDHTIRNTLISNINDYAPFLSEAVVEGSIFPQLMRGLQESNAYLREQSLKAMLPIAPKLSQRTLSQTLLKHLARLQVRRIPQLDSASGLQFLILELMLIRVGRLRGLLLVASMPVACQLSS